jgi:peptide deformylase
LSIPGVYADVMRSERVALNAYDLAGRELNMELDGLFARAVQHEIDHLDGILFIDRLSQTGAMTIADKLEDFDARFAGMRERGEIPDDAAIKRRLDELERLRT